jgi:murein DD-endopeptidase MepM/ murein hydrolase activator NlpD
VKKISAAVIGVAAVVASLTVAPAAQAAGRDGVCQAGEFCQYYNSNQAGSLSDFTGSISDYGANPSTCYVFKSTGAGKDLCVKNHAASVWNRSTSPVTVFYNSGYGGASQTIAPNTKANLGTALKNNNAGHRFGGIPNTSKMSSALYGGRAGRLTCAFDGYTSYPKSEARHEGIDFQLDIGSPVHALVEGTVVGLVRGANGSNSLSTIAVYNATYDKTVVYLHTAPLSSLTLNQKVSRGQKIATEGWRGVSSSKGHHTHVEVRNGKKTRAAVSFNATLENPDPTAFWKARGYTEN